MPSETLLSSAVIDSINRILVRYAMQESRHGPSGGLPEDVTQMLLECVNHINELERRESQRIDEIESLCSEIERLEAELMDKSPEEQEF